MGYIIYILIYILYKILSGFFRHFNFCSTVICSLFRCSCKFFPVPLFSGTFISVPLLSVPLFRCSGSKKQATKTGHKKTAYVLKNTPVFGPENLLPRRKCRTFAPSIERHTYFVLMWSQLPPHEKGKNTRNHGNQSKSNRAQRVLHEG